MTLSLNAEKANELARTVLSGQVFWDLINSILF